MHGLIMNPDIFKDDSFNNNTIPAPNHHHHHHHNHHNHHQNHKKSTLTLDFNQTKRNPPPPKGLKFPAKIETETPKNPTDRDGINIASTALLNTRPIEDNQPVVLTSPDLDLVKLSTPDLDNYLFQLQEELSVSSSNLRVGEGLDSSANSISCCNSSLDAYQVDCINYSMTGETDLQTKINTPSFREILDLAECVSIETRYNSFDSGFSDLSVKTEIESELEEEKLENDRIGWHIFENVKTKILFPKNAELMSTCCFGHQQTNLQSIKIEKHEFLDSNFQNQPSCEFNKLQPMTDFGNGDYYNSNNNNCNYISDNDYISKNDINNDSNKVPLYYLPIADNAIVNHYQGHHRRAQQEQTNNKQEKQNKSRQETHFKSPHNVSPHTKQNFIEEPNKRLHEFSCSSLDSNSGGLCSDYSSFDDGSSAPNLPQSVISQKGLSGNLSTQFGLDYIYKDGSKIDRISHKHLLDHDLCPMTVEAKRMSFRRQNAESRCDNEASHCQFIENETSKYQQDYVEMLHMKIEPNLDETFKSANSFDIAGQEFAKLQRKRARNRLAATRCRNRKLERISYLRAEVDYLKSVNVQYSDKVCRLRHEVNQLKCQVMNHVTKGCDLSCLWLSLK